MPQYRILIAANKFQTGFDEPLLHTMFVDKKLGDVATVQTLSRLNRTTAGKTSTMILDFVNDPEKIQEDFQRYYTNNFMLDENQTDPNELYDLLATTDAAGIYEEADVEAFGEIWFRAGDNKQDLQSILGRAVGQYKTLEPEAQEAFEKAAADFSRMYRFLSLIITFKDVLLEKQYAFLTSLLRKPAPHRRRTAGRRAGRSSAAHLPRAKANRGRDESGNRPGRALWHEEGQ